MKGTRRDWTAARAVPAVGGFAVHLDGRPLRLPGGSVLVLATRSLGEAIAREWEGRPNGEMIRRDDIPLTRLAGTAQESVAPDPQPTVVALAAFGKTDLLCYRAAAPEALVRRQQAVWQPWLDWAARELDAPLRVTNGVMPLAQEPGPLTALSRALSEAEVPALAALGVAVPALGSLVLGLAVVRGRLTAAEAATAAFVDEIFQAGVWGEDRIAADRRRATGAEVALAQHFLELARA